MYAAGVVLYELLTGTKPHEGETPIQVAYKHVHEDVPPPSSLAPGLPAYVDALVARATARDRELRPADAAVLLHQVHRVSHALAEGVLDDAELTADLTPLRMPVVVDPEPVGTDTAPDADTGAGRLRRGRVRGDDGAGAPPRPPTVASTPPRRPDPDRRARVVRPDPPLPDLVEPELPPRRSRPRRSKRGPSSLLLALLLVVGGGARCLVVRWTAATPPRPACSA